MREGWVELLRPLESDETFTKAFKVGVGMTGEESLGPDILLRFGVDEFSVPVGADFIERGSLGTNSFDFALLFSLLWPTSVGFKGVLESIDAAICRPRGRSLSDRLGNIDASENSQTDSATYHGLR